MDNYEDQIPKDALLRKIPKIPKLKVKRRPGRPRNEDLATRKAVKHLYSQEPYLTLREAGRRLGLSAGMVGVYRREIKGPRVPEF